MVKNLPAMQKKQVLYLGGEDHQEEGMATQTSIPAWRILRIEESGRLQSIDSSRVRHGWSYWAHRQSLPRQSLYLLLWARIPWKKWNSPQSQQRNPKCSTGLQHQKQQNDLGSFPRQTIQHYSNTSLCPTHWCWRSWSSPVLWRPTIPSRTNPWKKCPFHHKGLKCKRSKSRDTWSIWIPGAGEFGLG